MPKEDKKHQETLVLNSDGTTQKFVHKSKVSRSAISQEKHVKQEKNFKQEKHQMKQEKHEKMEKSERLVKSEKVEKEENPDVIDKPRLGRPLTSQEESILLPLLQGLLTANGNDTLLKTKSDNGSTQDKEPLTNTKSSRSGSLANNNENGKHSLVFSIFINFFNKNF